uniref:Uncharacterized protein LOC104241611 n=1 Tax=Nicotiana sylvestris TaxID=4096 RepID=A0A1U7Y6I4_NICSY|nr:PREDICTED: uncharacterized protein LOC104241611 [Nicotiana sylvestris]
MRKNLNSVTSAAEANTALTPIMMINGSEHSAHVDLDDVASPSFADLVFGYPENNGQSDLDLYRNVLASCIAKALEVFSCAKSNKSIL